MGRLGAKVKSCVSGNLLTFLTLVATVGGTVFGLALRASRDGDWTNREIMYVAYPGEIFLQMLKGLILPLIVSSIVAAIGSLDLSLSGRIGLRAILYYAATTVTAVLTGIFLTAVIRPGEGGTAGMAVNSTRKTTTADTLLDLVRSMFPPNLVQACVAQYQTVLIEPTPEEYEEAAAAGKNLTLTDWEVSGRFVSGSNTLGLVIFSVAMGITLAKMGAEARPLIDFFDSLNAAMLTMTGWVIWISPIGVFFLIGSKIIAMESVSVMAGQLGWYFMTVVMGLFIHGAIMTPLYFAVICRKLPFRYMYNMAEAATTAFGTGSSNACLPVTMKCVEEKNKVDLRISKFVLPIGATINMDGTALYEAVAAIFIAQLRRVPLGVGKYLAVSLTATMASIGAAGIPQAGLVTMVMVLDTVGLPADDVSIILAVDWLLDRLRTTVNVTGDALVAGIVDHLSRGELDEVDRRTVAEGALRRPSSLRPAPGSTAAMIELAPVGQDEASVGLLGKN
ncbi:excitatory amino acid transporter 1-like [Bacillus rossius redtenbacheri]|uniref:excitatory amino acid transporter 1-like n=1 Tax=Bacillus rossius redtenbacheri TaxID=93214 RepID=UPI002FDE9AE7